MRADLSVDWPTWSQSAYRSWSIGEPPEDLPEVVMEITLRLQRLAAMPDLDVVLACLPEESPRIGSDTLVRAAPVVEQVRDDATTMRFAVETTYQGTFRLDERAMEDATTLGRAGGPAGALGGVGPDPPGRPEALVPAGRPVAGRRRPALNWAGLREAPKPPPTPAGPPEGARRVGDDLGCAHGHPGGRSARDRGRG